MATIVLVHGAWHGGWCWQRVTPLLEKQGFTVRTVDLPSVGAPPGADTNLSADASAVDAVVEGAAGPVILCGHSYGIPSTYVVCARDMALPPDVQRNVFAPRATEAIELQADHSPFLSQPAAVAELLAARSR